MDQSLPRTLLNAMKDISPYVPTVGGSGFAAPVSMNDTQATYGTTIMLTLDRSYGCAAFVSTSSEGDRTASLSNL